MVSDEELIRIDQLITIERALSRNIESIFQTALLFKFHKQISSELGELAVMRATLKRVIGDLQYFTYKRRNELDWDKSKEACHE